MDNEFSIRPLINPLIRNYMVLEIETCYAIDVFLTKANQSSIHLITMRTRKPSTLKISDRTHLCWTQLEGFSERAEEWTTYQEGDGVLCCSQAGLVPTVWHPAARLCLRRMGPSAWRASAAVPRSAAGGANTAQLLHLSRKHISISHFGMDNISFARAYTVTVNNSPEVWICHISIKTINTFWIYQVLSEESNLLPFALLYWKTL